MRLIRKLKLCWEVLRHSGRTDTPIRVGQGKKDRTELMRTARDLANLLVEDAEGLNPDVEASALVICTTSYYGVEDTVVVEFGSVNLLADRIERHVESADKLAYAILERRKERLGKV